MKREKLSILVISFVVLIVVSVICIGIGRYYISYQEVIEMVCSKVLRGDLAKYPQNVQTVVFKLRIPRIAGDIVVGASLAVAGTVYQATFRNKLVSSDILGVSNGASVGAALAMIFEATTLQTQGFAFVLGVVAVLLSLLLSYAFKNKSSISLALSGMIISGFMSSTLSFIKYVADIEEKLPEIVYWLMGSMAKVTIEDVCKVAMPMIVSIAILILLAWKINIISMGEREAKTLGVNVKQVKIICIICSTILTVCSVCICGVIGWFGLMVPHICRMLVGDDNRYLIPCSALMGSILLVVLDTISRTLFVSEIPIGILTGITGTLIFAILVVVRRNDNAVGN